ncbi:HIPA PROTEIN [hydrothermal vent metagenome]|uniref:HIPA PROTEIN n=1 Tax=hydrothermal vent metagenome TaxID=652676 RepID=A0A3B0WI10_9ZZZZ
MNVISVDLWGQRVGALSWDDERQLASFQYEPAFIQSALDVSPIKAPLSNAVFEFAELAGTNTFKGLPGFIADSLPEKFGNRLLDTYLASHGRHIDSLNPLERLCYVGSRGMGALEYQPDQEDRQLNKAIPVEVSDLVEVAKNVLKVRQNVSANLDLNINQNSRDEKGIETLISVGTSAGGAKAKAVIAINANTNDVLSGQTNVPEGYEHWLLKFDEIDNEEHATNKQIGRIEYAYSEMAYAAGINMMECRLLADNDRAHFMTKRFDRVDGNDKVHVVTFAGMAHVDRDPPGNVGYERLFQTIRDLGLPQSDLSEMYRRMVFNICTRNQDDHTKNHAFIMFGDGHWQLSPAYDLCFSYQADNPFIAQHQMSCNGKRDNFELDDLLAAAKSADVSRPREIIAQVENAVLHWQEHAEKTGIKEEHAASIGNLYRHFTY